MEGWEQSSEWMEMKANGYRTGFSEAVAAIQALVDPDFAVPEPAEDSRIEEDFMQDPDLADHAGSRF